MRNHYDILCIPRNATPEQVKTAYRKLSFKFHPDKNNGEAFFSDMFKQINEAYTVLYNVNSRKAYDLLLYRFEHPEIVNNNIYQPPHSAPPKTNYSTSRSNEPKDKWASVRKWKKRRNVMLVINGMLIFIVFIIPRKDSTGSGLPVRDSVSSTPKLPIRHHRRAHHISKHRAVHVENSVDTIATKTMLPIQVPIANKAIDSSGTISSRMTSMKDTVIARPKKRKRGFFSRIFGKQKRDST